MLLPEGITGFSGIGAARPPEVDLDAFARACHAVARAGSGRVEEFEPPGPARNHHRAVLRLRDGAIAMLCNAHYPWVAFAEADGEASPRFVESAALASRFREAMPCEVLDLSLLEAAPDAAMLECLGAAEREQIRYWRPGRVGEIIFNSWD